MWDWMEEVLGVVSLETREGICWTEGIAFAKEGTEMWINLTLFKNRGCGSSWWESRKGSIGSVVGSKTANVKWIQRANLCFGKAPETSSHAVLAIRGLSRVEVLRAWKTEGWTGNDWGLGSLQCSSMERAMWEALEEELVKYCKQLWKTKRY